MPTKCYQVRQAAVSALHAWANGHDYAETLIERHAQRRKLSPSDRHLLQAILLGVLRNRRILDAWISKLRKGKLDPETKDVLRVGLFQLLILNLPDHAAVHETVEAAKSNVRGLINAVLRRAILSRKSLLDHVATLPTAEQFSHPDWLFKRWRMAFGKDHANALMEWNNLPAETFFRTNPLAPELTDTLPGKPLLHAPDYYQLEGNLPTSLLASGQIYIQDPATRHAVELLHAQKGERILDACAAPGGKAFLIASQLGGGATLTCTDSNEKRLPRLQDNLKRLHIQDATIAQHDWTQPAPAHFHQQFDAILLDVPCSNSGVMRRRVDVRWRIQPQTIDELIKIQSSILANAVPCLKPNGRIIYSTCSIEEAENQDQIQSFLKTNPQFKLTETRTVLPFKDHTDGAFAARLELKS